jgi:hypothetical protein
MSESFASPAQLSARLGRPFDETETEQAQLFLTDATEYLRAEFDGAFINQGTASAVLHVRAGQARVKIPQWSVTNVSAVTINDREYVGNWEVRDDFLVFPGGFQGDAQIVVEFSFGQDPVPAELVMWTCVLAAGGLAQVNRSGTKTSSKEKSLLPVPRSPTTSQLSWIVASDVGTTTLICLGSDFPSAVIAPMPR